MNITLVTNDGPISAGFHVIDDKYATLSFRSGELRAAKNQEIEIHGEIWTVISVSPSAYIRSLINARLRKNSD